MGPEDAHIPSSWIPGAKNRVNGVTFDAAGLIALVHNDRRVLALLAIAIENGDEIVVPATALA